MLSLELSSIQQRDPDRAMLAEAMARYEAQGRLVEVVPTSRSLFNPVPFNSEQINPNSPLPPGMESDPLAKNKARGVTLPKSAAAKAFEAELAEKLRDYYDRGVVAAAKDLRISARRVSHIALEYGIKFASRLSAAAKQEDLQMVPLIRQYVFEGLGQAEMCEKLGIGRTSLKRIAGQNGIRFRKPGDREKELKLVERIKAMKEIGVSRAACARQLELNEKVLIRLIDKYRIEYPLRLRA